MDTKPQKPQEQDSQPDRTQKKKDHPIIRRLKLILHSRIAKVGSAVSIVTGFISILTPVGQSIAPILTAWNAGWQAFSIVKREPRSDVTVYQSIDPVTRREHMNAIFARLRQSDRRVLAIAFYGIVQTDFSGYQLFYQGDTRAADGGEMFFYDFDTQPEPRTQTNPLVLSDRQWRDLSLKNCILVKDAGHFGMTTSSNKFNSILCPTIAIVPDAQDPRLTKFVVRNVVAIAVPADVNSIDPFAGWIFDYVPSIENVVESSGDRK